MVEIPLSVVDLLFILSFVSLPGTKGTYLVHWIVSISFGLVKASSDLVWSGATLL